MRRLPFDHGTMAFTTPPARLADQITVVWGFIKSFGKCALFYNIVSSVVVLICIGLLTNAFAGRSVGWCGIYITLPIANYQSKLFVLIALMLVWYDLKDNFIEIVNVGSSAEMPDVTYTMILLTCVTYIVVEVVLGPGTGADWAPDFVIAWTAAWLFRLILGWEDYSRVRLSKVETASHERQAWASVAACPDRWFVN